MSRRRGRGEGSVTHLPDGRWRGCYTKPGPPGAKQRRGVVYGATKAECLARLHAARSQHRPLHEEAGSLTVADWLDRWLSLRQLHIAPGSHDLYKCVCDTHLKPTLGHVPLSKLTALHVVQATTEWVTNGVRAHTHRAAISVLRIALNAAKKYKLIPENVANDVDRPPENRKPVEAMSAAQVRAVLAATEPAYRPLFTLAFDTGARPGELLALDAEDIDFSRGTVRINKSLDRPRHGRPAEIRRPKTASSVRTLPVSPATLAALRTSGPPWGLGHHHYIRAWRAAIRAAGLPHFKPYTPRHTMATLLLASGVVDIKTVAERLGHTKADMLFRHYAAVLEGQRHRAVDVLGEILKTSTQTAPDTATSPQKT